MANPHRGEVAVEFGGLTLTLAFSNAARRALETAVGAPIRTILQRFEADATDPDLAAAAIFALSRRHHPDVTRERVAEVLDDMAPHETAPLMISALEAVVYGLRGPIAPEADAADPQTAGTK